MTINYENLKHISRVHKNYSNSKLMIVTKTRTVDDVVTLIQNNHSLFGENKVQEAQFKFSDLRKLYKFDLHLIGPLQTNKVTKALSIFDSIQTLDREKLAIEIKKNLNLLSITKSFFIQINIGKENQKSGIMPEDFNDFYKFCLNLELPIEGIMCIPPKDDQPNIYFQHMNKLRDETNSKLKLSMGMSNDFKLALDNNSNITRIGSLVFC